MTEPEFTDADPASTPAPVATSGGRRGRPRARETLDRDQRVLDALANGPLTREQLADQLGDSSSLIYLALYRLTRQDPPRVEKVTDGAVRNVWRRVDVA